MGDARDNNLDGKVMDFESFSLKYFFFFFLSLELLMSSN